MFSKLFQSKGDSERHIAVLSQEMMTGGYKRQIVISDGEAATVSDVRLVILATMADGLTSSSKNRRRKANLFGTAWLKEL